jgi:hypothetical protein
VDDTLGDPLAIEVGEKVDQVKVLEEERAILAHALKLLGVWYGSSIGRGVDRLLRVLEGGSLLVGTHDYRSEGLWEGGKRRN